MRSTKSGGTKKQVRGIESLRRLEEEGHDVDFYRSFVIRLDNVLSRTKKQ